MPTIDVSHSDICSLIGKNIDIKRLENELLYAKAEVDGAAGDTIKLDIKDTNRPDLWSAEGVAREVRLRYKGDFPNYNTKKSGVIVNVDKSVKYVRPLTVCAVVRGMKMTQNILSQMIQLQEKVAINFGKNRKEVAIGVYDLHKIKSPIKYTTVGRTGIKFRPLDFEKELTPQEIIEKHPKGKEFGHLVKGDRVPIFIDSAGNVLSMPPIINSDYTGKVTEKTTDVFIECSGADIKFLSVALNVMVTAMHERKGKIETVDVIYEGEKIITPNLIAKKFFVEEDYINKISGLELARKDINNLLKMSGYLASGNKKIKLMYPAYRQDIMHQRDVVEDLIISYGFNKINFETKKLPSSGIMLAGEKIMLKLSETLVGCGLQEIMSYTLTNKKELFDNMNIQQSNIAEIDNPMSSNWSVFRTWMLPSLMDFLSKNKHVEYPHEIFEIGKCVLLDEKEETKSRDITKLASAISNSTVNYEDMSSILDAFMRNIGIQYKLKSHNHKSFMEGRSAEIIVNSKQVGFIGEIHPIVLNNWNLEKPVVAFEINLSDLFDMN